MKIGMATDALGRPGFEAMMNPARWPAIEAPGDAVYRARAKDTFIKPPKCATTGLSESGSLIDIPARLEGLCKLAGLLGAVAPAAAGDFKPQAI